MTVGLILLVQESKFQIKDGNSKLKQFKSGLWWSIRDTRIFEKSNEDKGYL